MSIELTVPEAKRFLLLKHGLAGAHRFAGKEGAYLYARQTGCIQYDPIDACGKNSELAFFSRVKNFKKKHLDELLYKDRLLVDYPDKNISLIPTEDWPYFERYREAARRHLTRYPEVRELTGKVVDIIKERGAVCSDDFALEGNVEWHSAIHWSAGNVLSRSVLEQLYSTGDLIVHHKKGPRKYYDLAERHIPEAILKAPEPLPDEFDHLKWRVLRRIGAVGLLWNRPSDAWLNIWELTSEKRAGAFNALLDEQKLTPVRVSGIRDPLYIRSEDAPLMDAAINGGPLKKRCEFIAPLDCFMWDRKLIERLFGFHYAWEIYTPAANRKYGYYVLPMLYGEEFAGRIEATADKKTSTLIVKNIWYESGFKQTKAFMSALEKCVFRLARFNECGTIEYGNA